MTTAALFHRTDWMQAKLDWYAGDHRDRVNHAIHVVCIPLILMSAFGLLIPPPPHFALFGVPIGWPEISLAALVFFYARHDVALALLAAFTGAVLVVAARHIPWKAHIVIFAAAWIAQFIGHGAFEKNRPSLSANLVSLIIAPAFLLADLLPKKR